MTIPDVRHPNSPLVEVVFEVRFPGETAVECRRHELQNLIKVNYPRLLVPTPEPGVAVAFQPYRFEREDTSAGVMTSAYGFAYYCRSCPGFEKFRPECLELMSLFFGLFKVEKLTRVGLRHVNIIPFAREDGVAPVEYFFTVGGPLLSVLSGRIAKFSTGFAMLVEGGEITTRIESMIHKDGSQEAFLLDFDFAKSGDLDATDVGKYLDEAHDQSASLFNNLVTKKYHDYIRGEGV